MTKPVSLFDLNRFRGSRHARPAIADYIESEALQDAQGTVQQSHFVHVASRVHTIEEPNHFVQTIVGDDGHIVIHMTRLSIPRTPRPSALLIFPNSCAAFHHFNPAKSYVVSNTLVRLFAPSTLSATGRYPNISARSQSSYNQICAQALRCTYTHSH